MLSYYVVKDWREGCERCKEILRYGGMGHTMSIHSRNDDVILEFGLHKPAYRICVNTPSTLGAIGLTTGLDPAMTLGCGGFGGNITSDNISPRHLLNIKRLAYETRPVTGHSVQGASGGSGAARWSGAAGQSGAQVPARPRCRRRRPSPRQNRFAAETLTGASMRSSRHAASRGSATAGSSRHPGTRGTRRTCGTLGTLGTRGTCGTCRSCAKTTCATL